ncbi:MAG: hypothetical protein ABWX92_07085 [Mycetocola sp.]
MTALTDITPSEEQGFIQLTTSEGAEVWIIVGCWYAIEKSPNENFTLVKTASELFTVMEPPARIFKMVEELQEKQQAERMARMREAEQQEDAYLEQMRREEADRAGGGD